MYGVEPFLKETFKNKVVFDEVGSHKKLMRNKDSWSPNKFIYKKGRLIASRNPKEVPIGSRLVTDLVARYYDLYIQKYSRGNLVDLGCGKVPLYEAYKDYITNNTCIDWGGKLKGLEHLDFECDLNRTLPLKDEEFDTIILSDVLEHIAEPEQLWREMFRILTIGGRIIMNVPFYYPLHEAPYDFYRYTEYSLRRLADSTGFQVLLLKSIGGSTAILADILAKHLQYLSILGKPLSIGIQNITYFLLKTNLGEKISEKTAKVFPFGYFLIAEKIA